MTYRFNTPIVSGRVTGYYTRFNDQVEMDAFYNDNEARFTYLSMSGIDKENWGVEAAATFKLMSNLSLTAIGTWSDARYMNNPMKVKVNLILTAFIVKDFVITEHRCLYIASDWTTA